MYRDVFIFHSGDDPDDRAFAQTIADRIQYFAIPHLIDVDGLERQDIAGHVRPERFVGVPVYVISPSMLRDPEYRHKLVIGTPGRNSPWRWVFYICRGIKFEEIRNNYPDLEKLLFDVMVGDESHLPNLLDELRMYLTHVPKYVGTMQRIRELLGFAASILMVLFGSVFLWVYFLAFMSSFPLYYSMLVTGARSAFEFALAFHVLFAAGYSMTRLPPLDFWTELGPAWKVRERPGYGDPSRQAHSDSECHVGVFRQAAAKWMKELNRSLLWLLFRLCFFLIPGIALVLGTDLFMPGIGIIIAGLFMPLLWSRSLRHIKKLAYREVGMSNDEMDRTTRFFDYFPPAAGMSMWTVHRRLLEAPVNVFISHAWDDDNFTTAAEKLHEIVTDFGIPCFLDKQRMPGKFTAWRSQILNDLLECTHFFIVLGPQTGEARGVHLEVRTTLQRWYTDLEPAIICIVDPNVADVLEEQKDIPREIKFLLNECPKVTYEEASNPDVVAHLIRQRRRQGLLRDWVTLTSPFGSLKQILHEEVASTYRLSNRQREGK